MLGEREREGKRREEGGEKEIEQRGWVQEVQMGKENEDKELSGLQGQQKAFHKPSCSFSGDALK